MRRTVPRVLNNPLSAYEKRVTRFPIEIERILQVCIEKNTETSARSCLAQDGPRIFLEEINMSAITTTIYEGYEIHTRAVPTGDVWAAEYSVSKDGETKIPWTRANIAEGLPTHGTANHAALDNARADINDKLLKFS
jgi:hypothetical protein